MLTVKEHGMRKRHNAKARIETRSCLAARGNWKSRCTCTKTKEIRIRFLILVCPANTPRNNNLTSSLLHHDCNSILWLRTKNAPMLSNQSTGHVMPAKSQTARPKNGGAAVTGRRPPSMNQCYITCKN